MPKTQPVDASYLSLAARIYGEALTPHSTDRMPTYRASQRKKLRTLAERLRLLAEHHILELEKAPQVDADKLMAALELMKMARVVAKGRRRRRKDMWSEAKTGRQRDDEQQATRRAITELHDGGVNIDRAPKDAVQMVIEANMPPLGAALRPRMNKPT